MIALLLSISLQKVKSDKTASHFSMLAHMLLGFLITDLICDLIDGKSGLTVFAYIVNTLDFLWIDAIIIAFSAYLCTLVGHVSRKWEKVMNPGVFFTYIRIVVIIALTIAGKLFTIDENGYYQEQSLALVPYVMMLFIMFLLLIVILRHKPYFKSQQLMVMLTYLLLPLASAVLEMITGSYCFAPAAITISVLFIYTMVQSEIIEEYRVRESLLEEISSTDLLTNMNNRRAYYNRFASLDPQEHIGVIFCDINGLKYTNDTFGHAEGDKLIIRFSELLASVFSSKDIFRISGDEFVVLIPGITDAGFHKKTADLQKLVTENDTIAAFGFSYGTGCCIEQLVSVAEGAMYDNKRAYYTQNNIQRGDALPRHDFLH